MIKNDPGFREVIYRDLHKPLLQTLLNTGFDMITQELYPMFEDAGLIRNVDFYPVVVGGSAYNKLMEDNKIDSHAVRTYDIDYKFFVHHNPFANTSDISIPIYSAFLDGFIKEYKGKQLTTELVKNEVDKLVTKVIGQNSDYKKHEETVRKNIMIRLFRHLFIHRTADYCYKYLKDRCSSDSRFSAIKDVGAYPHHCATKYPQSLLAFTINDLSSIKIVYSISLPNGEMYSEIMVIMDSTVISNANKLIHWWDMYPRYNEILGARRIDKNVAPNTLTIPVNSSPVHCASTVELVTIHFALLDTLRMIKKASYIDAPAFDSIDVMFSETYKLWNYVEKFIHLLAIFMFTYHKDLPLTNADIRGIESNIGRMGVNFPSLVDQINNMKFNKTSINQDIIQAYKAVVRSMYSYFEGVLEKFNKYLRDMWSSLPEEYAPCVARPYVHILHNVDQKNGILITPNLNDNKEHPFAIVVNPHAGGRKGKMKGVKKGGAINITEQQQNHVDKEFDFSNSFSVVPLNNENLDNRYKETFHDAQFNADVTYVYDFDAMKNILVKKINETSTSFSKLITVLQKNNITKASTKSNVGTLKKNVRFAKKLVSPILNTTAAAAGGGESKKVRK